MNLTMKHVAFAFTLALCGSAADLGAQQPTTAVEAPPPSGNIHSTAPTCGGKITLAIGKKMTLTAQNPKDCDTCPGAIEIPDTIQSPSGIKWVINSAYGNFVQGGATGSPKTWKAVPSVHTGVAVRLKLKDQGAPAPAVKDQLNADGLGFIEVASINMDIVIPNAEPAGFPHVNPSTCQAGGHGTAGARILIQDAFERANCAVDFSNLQVQESNCNNWNPNTCLAPNGPATFGGGIATIGAGGVLSRQDEVFLCITPPGGGDPVWVPNCMSIRQCQWQIRSPGPPAGQWINFFTRVYTLQGGPAGSTISQVTPSAALPVF